MSHDLSSPTSTEPPSADSTPNDFIFLSFALQSIAKVLLDKSSTPETTTYRESTVLHRIAQLLLNKHHPYDLYECLDDIYAELSIILDLLSHINGGTSTSALNLYVLHKNLKKSVRKLEEFAMQFEASYIMGNTSAMNPQQ